MVAKTVITQAGIAAVIAAGTGGPAIKVAKVRFGSTLIDPLASMTDVDSFVYESTGAAIRYSIRDENSVNYRIILDETIGDFTIGNYALVLEDGTIFSITSLNSTLTKTATVGMVLGNRRIFNLPLVLSGLASISNFTLILADELSIPEVATQAVLPGAGAAPFNLYLVRQHTLFANRATLAAAVAGSWRYFPEDLGAGAAAETNGITIASAFDVGVSSGNAVWFNTATDKFELSNVSTHPPRGIRGQGDTFRYNDYKNTPKGQKPKEATMRLHYVPFLDRLLQHVPTEGFVQVRYYGCYAIGKMSQMPAEWKVGPTQTPEVQPPGLEDVWQEEVWEQFQQAYKAAHGHAPMTCPHCRQVLRRIAFVPPSYWKRPAARQAEAVDSS
jgi:hypothetical protein